MSTYGLELSRLELPAFIHSGNFKHYRLSHHLY